MLTVVLKRYFMRIFKNKDFNKWAAKEGIDDSALVMLLMKWSEDLLTLIWEVTYLKNVLALKVEVKAAVFGHYLRINLTTKHSLSLVLQKMLALTSVQKN